MIADGSAMLFAAIAEVAKKLSNIVVSGLLLRAPHDEGVREAKGAVQGAIRAQLARAHLCARVRRLDGKNWDVWDIHSSKTKHFDAEMSRL